ncbi:DUF3887 domain-containing protein [Reichenbachiella ulvae]|uniref:DUF3887 domain-containing protein n=1 Tax=Reichenbachiella ulvae TaxID=2980104 RepID=A0ABT3CVL6_9BACT|nr:DUF3887 domain-containing protein [Reichenbachiella ulvae]MCV9387740.1 DUF3887 domain-containing protein [Reichenbachiella ulvae]
MKTTSLFLFASLLFFQCANATIEGEDELIEVSDKILDNLIKNDFEAARSDFNDQMTAALQAQQLKEVWNGLSTQLGSYQSKGDVTTDTIQGYRVVYTILKFEQSPFKLKVVFDDADKVAGLFLVPTNAK